MAEEESGNNPNPEAKPGNQPAAGGTEPQFRIHKVFLKDVSFESPQTPAVFVASNNWKPQVSLQINTESLQLENDLLETVLTVNVTVKSDDKSVYLVEVKQAGLFLLKDFPEGDKQRMLGTFCPNILFPFAREEIAALVAKGGFPQLLLDPVNFDALYAQHLAQARQNAPAPETPQ